MRQFRVIVCGCRNWHDEELFFEAMENFIRQPATAVVVHGDCPSGADALAKRYCSEYGAAEEPHPADWKKYGKPAGMRRNAEMAKSGADACLAFWDGKSPGTRNMIEVATMVGIPVRIIPWRDH